MKIEMLIREELYIDAEDGYAADLLAVALQRVDG